MSPPNANRVIAAVLAGGTGARFAGEVPKQFAELAGRSVLAHSLLAFEAAPTVDEIVLVSHIDHIDEAAAIANEAGVTKLSAVVAGGATRSESSMAAVAAAPQAGSTALLIHDAARPLVELATVDAVVHALRDHRAVAPAIEVTDTVALAADGVVAAMPERDSMQLMQTPQGFDLKTIREAYRRAAADPAFAASDDCGVVHRYMPEVEIRLVAGSSRNIKITRDSDLRLAAMLLLADRDSSG